MITIKGIQVKEIAEFKLQTEEFKKWLSELSEEERKYLKENGWI